MSYDKSDFAGQLGISNADLESKARDAGFGTTEDYYNSGLWQGAGDQLPSTLDFATNLETGISDSLNQYILALKGQQSPLDVYTQLEDAMGIPGQRKVAQTLREQVYDIEDTVKRVEPTIAATTKQSLVTEGQRQQMVTSQKKPLLERLGELSTSLGRIDKSIASNIQELSTRVNLFLQGQQMQLEPFRIQYQYTVDQASRLLSAFSVDAQNQFKLYLTRLQRGWDLSDQERSEAFSLLQQENEYTRLLQSTAASAGANLTGNETNEELLQLIGQQAADELEFSRRDTSGTDNPFLNTFADAITKSLGIGNDDSPTGWEVDYSPQMSANPGTTAQTTGPNGIILEWTAGEDGSWY